MNKKHLWALIIVLCTSINTWGQSLSNTFTKGDQWIHMGVNVASLALSDRNTILPSLQGVYEYAAYDGLIDGLGGIGIGVESFISLYGNTAKEATYKHRISSALAFRGVLHYEFVPLLDTYAGMSLGLGGHLYTSRNDAFQGKKNGLGVVHKFFVGTRYMPTKRWGVYGELTLGSMSVTALGIDLGIAISL